MNSRYNILPSLISKSETWKIEFSGVFGRIVSSLIMFVSRLHFHVTGIRKVTNRFPRRNKQMKSKQFNNSREEIEKILYVETVGYLGLSQNNKPLVVPLNYIYTEGVILFHCALKGQKLDYLKSNSTVCFAVARQTGTVEQHEENNLCLVFSESVLCFGNARIIEDLKERQKALNIFNKRFKPDADEISLKRTKNCYVFEIKIREMTGRREVNLKRTHWEYRFDD